jgi:predicted ATPase
MVEYEEIIGYHLEQATRYRSELGPLDERGREVGATASRHLASAGRRVLSQGDVAAAANLLGRAAELLPPDDPYRPAILADRGAALSQTDMSRAEEVLAEAIDAARVTGDRLSESRARIRDLKAQFARIQDQVTNLDFE